MHNHYLYSQLAALQASNEYILRMYNSLLKKKGDEEEEQFKETILHKENIRRIINEELSDCLQEILKERDLNLITKSYNLMYPQCLRLFYKIQNILFSPSIEKCQYVERKNLGQYYTTLYDQRYSKKVTNLLLRQKSMIEEQVIT